MSPEQLVFSGTGAYNGIVAGVFSWPNAGNALQKPAPAVIITVLWSEFSPAPPRPSRAAPTRAPGSAKS
jgi:hypothetical protein